MRKLTAALVVLAASVVVSVLLAESYAWMARLMASEVWVAAAVLHTVFACFAAYLFFKKRVGSLDVTVVRGSYRPFLLALVLMSVTVLGAVATRVFMPGASSEEGLTWHHIAWVVWIPVVEEFMFRVLCGAIYRAHLGLLWGSYASALFFSVMHSFPTMQRWQSGDVGVTLGPLFLGVICEYLWVKTGRIMPMIAFHAACNLTVPVFLKIDQRWISWLGILYQ